MRGGSSLLILNLNAKSNYRHQKLNPRGIHRVDIGMYRVYTGIPEEGDRNHEETVQ